MMKKNKKSALLLLAIPFGLITLQSLPSLADDDTRQGVEHTQKLLKDPEFRANNAKESKPAAELDKHIKVMTNNPATEQEMYELAAEVMGNMKDLTPEQMSQVVEAGQKNPAAFAEKFSPAQKQKLHEIADRLPAAKAK